MKFVSILCSLNTRVEFITDDDDARTDTLVSAPDPNRPPAQITSSVTRGELEEIRAGVGLGLGPRLQTHKLTLH